MEGVLQLKISIHFPKKYTPACENDQNSPKSAKWLKIQIQIGSQSV